MKINTTGILAISLLVISGISTLLEAKTFTVTNTHDEGKGSLRQAICEANKRAQSDIVFNLPKSDSGYNEQTDSWCIKPVKELPTLTSAVEINGFSQQGAHRNCNPITEPDVANIKIELCGPGLLDQQTTQGCSTGLTFGRGSDCSKLKGLAINGFRRGVVLEAHGVFIGGCYLGVSVDGVTARPNIVSVYIASCANKSIIGKCKPAARNLICGIGQEQPTVKDTQTGATVLGAITNYGSRTSIQGSTINLDKSGKSVLLPNALYGIVSIANHGALIGGPKDKYRVVVSGHYGSNLHFDCTSGHTVQNVLAGTDLNGTCTLGGTAGLCIVCDQVLPNGTLPLDADGFTNRIEDSLFSGHSAHGIVLGRPYDSAPAQGVLIRNTKCGTDLGGNGAIPNGVHGISIANARSTTIEKSSLCNNGDCGIHQDYSKGTHIHSCDVSKNVKGGIKVEPVSSNKLADDQFDVRFSKGCTAKGNGRKAIMAPGGSLETLTR